MDELFAQDDVTYSFGLYVYLESLRRLYLKVYKDREIFYIGFGQTIYYSGTVGWSGKKFYQAPKADLINLVNSHSHLKNFVGSDMALDMFTFYVFPSEQDNVLIIAAGHSIMKEKPKLENGYKEE